MSIFDPDTFLSAETSEANDTVVIPCPEGQYLAVVESIEIKEIEGKDGTPRYPCQIVWSILDEEVKAALGRDKLTARQTLWLDIDSNGRIDSGKGKNIGLGKLRAALGQNEPGKPWAPSHLNGAGPALVKVTHRADKDDPEIKYAEIKTVGRAE